MLKIIKEIKAKVAQFRAAVNQEKKLADNDVQKLVSLIEEDIKIVETKAKKYMLIAYGIAIIEFIVILALLF